MLFQISVVLKMLEQMLSFYSFFSLGSGVFSEIEATMTSLFGNLPALKMASEVCVCVLAFHWSSHAVPYYSCVSVWLLV
jgi:hypothetical protein